MARQQNILAELDIPHDPVAAMFNDNQAAINFVKGDAVAKGLRHMELRMWYTRDQYKKGKATLEYVDGTILPADRLTKLGNVREHRAFVNVVMGLGLTGTDYFAD